MTIEKTTQPRTGLHADRLVHPTLPREAVQRVASGEQQQKTVFDGVTQQIQKAGNLKIPTERLGAWRLCRM